MNAPMNASERVWSLQEAKSKFSEVVRRAQTEGPQTVTVHGKAAVVIAAASEVGKAPRKLTGADLVKAFQVYSGPELKIPQRPRDSTFRDVEL